MAFLIALVIVAAAIAILYVGILSLPFVLLAVAVAAGGWAAYRLAIGRGRPGPTT